MEKLEHKLAGAELDQWGIEGDSAMNNFAQLIGWNIFSEKS